MGLYEEIVLNSKKKKEEEKTTSFADSIIQSGKTDVNKRYESQKQVVSNIKSDLQSALYKENQKNGLFTTPVVPTKKASDFINSAMYKNDTENKETSNQYNPYDVKENAKKFQKSLEATKDISDKIATERNTLKYDKYLKTADDVSKEKTTLWDKTGGVVVRGLADLGSSFTIEDRKYTDENGNTIFLPSYSDLKQQKVSEDYKTGVGKFLGDFGYNTTKILGSTALNAVTAGIGGSALYWQDMAVDNYTNAINQGYKGANAAAYSLVSTGLEYAVGKVLGGATGKLTGGSMRELDTALSNVMNKVIGNPTLARIIGTGGSEFTEEFIQEYLDNINKLLILEGNTKAKDYVSILTNPEVLGDALYSGLIGFASGGLVEATNNNDVNRNIKMFQNFKEQLEQRKTGTTDVKTIEQINKIIENIDNYLEKPFSIDSNTIEITQNNVNALPTNQTTNVNENINPLENLQEFTQRQQETKNQQIQEETNSQIKELQNQVEELNKKNDNNFSQQVDEVLNGTYPKQNMLIVSKNTPQILQDIGLNNLPITITQRHLKTIINSSGEYKGANYHDLGVDIVKQLPEAIAQPLNVLKSDTVPNSIVVITELADKQDRPVIASIRIDGTGTINDIEIDSNVLTSAYGRNNYDSFMQKNIAKGNLLYDIDEGIIKRSDGKLQLRPTTSSTNDNTTNLTKSQIAPLPTQYNMQQNRNNIPTKQTSKANTKVSEVKLPTKEIKTNKTSIPMAKKDDVIKVASQKIAKQINSTGGFDLKQRSWVGTSTESEILKNKVYIDDLDVKKINYVVQSNKKSLDNANNRLKNNGYEKTLDYVKSIMQSDKLPSASDVVLMQRMIQEASKKGDAQTVQDLIMNTAIIGTDLGQATQALSIIQRLTPEGQLKMYTKLVQRAKSRGEKSFQNVEITPEMVQNVLEAYKKDGTYDQDDLNNRVEKFKQDIADQMKTTTGEKIDAWRYLSMLGNPKTHIRNMVSNVAMRGTIKVKNAMARTMETILPVKDRTKTWKKASNAVQNFAEETANEMKGIITGENKYNEKSSIESKKQIFKNKVLEKISNFNSNALEAEDWFFSKKAFKDTLQEYLTANNINTQEDIKNNAELVEKAKLYAVEQAEIATFRQYSKLAATIGQLERKSKVGRIAIEALMPFKKTPVNVAKAGVSYSPIGLLKNISYDVYQLKQGNINASQFIDNLAQGLTGTSLTLLGYALAKSGVLSGSGGDDKDDKYDKQLGKTGYSLNIGGNSYSISWLSPVAMPLLVGSNAYEQLEEDKEWDMNVVSDTLAKTLDPLNEMSFMQGLTNALQSYGSGADKIKGSLESTGQNYVGQFFPTLFSQLAATTDDKKRSTKASNNSSYKFGEQTIRSIMYKVPGLRQQLEVATDIWGNEKEQSDNILVRALESFIAPYSKNKDISTNLDKEIKRVYNETGESGVIPNIPYAYTKYDGETYKMSAKEYTDFKKTYGQTANSTLNKLINSADYKQATDEDKAKMIDSVYDYARAKANEEYFNNSDINYENQMIDKLDTLKSNYGISADTYFANKKEYDYAYQNPDKYSVIRQIAKFGKYTTYKNEIIDIRNNTSNDKIETIKYINSLNMNIPQKAMFIKQYYKSFKQYDSQIIQYINNQKLTSKEKEQILTQLGFTIKDGRVYY